MMQSDTCSGLTRRYGELVASLAAALLLAACGQDAEPPEVVDVNPMESQDLEKPEFEDSRPEGTPLDNAFAPQVDEQLKQPEQSLFATADIQPVAESGVTGSVDFEQQGDLLRINGTIRGLSPGPHGIHIHRNGDCSGLEAANAGAHFAPDGDPHGSPLEPTEMHHAGDLGNIGADADGNAEFEKTDSELTLDTSANSIVGSALIVHAEADNLQTQPAGGSGDRIGCAIIVADPRPAYIP